MRTIQLTQGQFAIVDDIWYEYLMQWKWYALWNKNSRIFYAKRKEGHQHIWMHRVITYAPSYLEVDHIDHIGTHNWIMNLRWATRAQQTMNQRKQNGTSSIYKGVYWKKRNQKWMAYITYAQRRIYLGLFEEESDAGMAYDEAAMKFFGEFALLNFPS